MTVIKALAIGLVATALLSGCQATKVRVGDYTVHLGSASVAQAAEQAAMPSDERSRWSIDLLAQLGNSAPTQETIELLNAWQQAEDGDMSGAFARHNPLNTTQDAPGAWTINSVNVRGFPSREIGMQATVETVTNGRYPSILAGLVGNNPELALNEEELATWGTGLSNVERVFGQGGDVRQRLVEYALSLEGLPYIYGGRTTAGADCSGTMQLVYKTVTGIDIGATTYSQQPNLREIDLKDVQPGDLWFGQFSDDQHVGMVADIDQDGRWDLINNGGLSDNMHVDLDFMSNEYFSQHTIGFRSAL